MSNDAKMSNQVFLEHLESGDSGMLKKAQDAVNDFTRVKMREDGFFRKILPPITITNDELDRQVDTDKPVKIVDKEPGSRASISVPFATLPMARYIRGPRYRVMFNRILTPKFVKDVDELRTYHMDIRQVISDNAIKDMLAEEDGKFIKACVGAVGGAAGATVAETGVVQWHTTSDEITRESLVESTKTMPSTPSSLEATTALINNITIKDILKWFRDESGGDIAEDMLLKGFTEKVILGIKIIVTIKRDIVPTNTLYYFAEPKVLGKFFILEDATMFMKREHFMVEFFAYESIGAAIGNNAAVARHDFNVSTTPTL